MNKTVGTLLFVPAVIVCSSSFLPTSVAGGLSLPPTEIPIQYSVDSVGSNPTFLEYVIVAAERETTDVERAVAEMRSWTTWTANWDGEGAVIPNRASLREGTDFLRALAGDVAVPTPLLHPDGMASLFWRAGNYYAELEFQGDGRVAYYVEQGNNRHKGVMAYEGGDVPSLLEPLLLRQANMAPA